MTGIWFINMSLDGIFEDLRSVNGRVWFSAVCARVCVVYRHRETWRHTTKCISWLKCGEVEGGRNAMGWEGGRRQCVCAQLECPMRRLPTNKQLERLSCVYYLACLLRFGVSFCLPQHLTPPLLLFSFSFPVISPFPPCHCSVGRVAGWSLHIDRLPWLLVLLPFACIASICQAVIGLAQSTLLEPPRRHSLRCPCSPDMSRGWWVAPSWTDQAYHRARARESFVVCDFGDMCCIFILVKFMDEDEESSSPRSSITGPMKRVSETRGRDPWPWWSLSSFNPRRIGYLG